jgi:hypothetical protein
MKQLSRWIAILGMTSATILAPALGRQLPAQALPEPQVMQILSVPMFVITDAKGEPLASQIPDPRNKSKQIQRLLFFVSPQDAQEALNFLRTKDPKVGNSAKVTLTSLSSILQFAKQNANAGINTQVLPNSTQLQAAVALLRQSGDIKEQGGQLVGKDGKPFPLSAPLFFVTNNQNEPIGLQRTIKENGKDKVVTAFPMFFSKQDAQMILDQSRKQDPKLVSTTKIHVAMLAGVMNFLLTNNDPATAQVELVPPRESREFLQRQGGGRPPAAAPGGRPPAAPGARPPAASPSPAAPAGPPARPK